MPLLCRTPPALLPPAQEQCQHLYLRAAKSQDRGCSRLRAATSARGHLCHTTWRSAPVHAPRSSGQRCGQRVWRWLLALRRKPPRAFLFRYLASLRAEYVFHIFHMRSIYRHVYSYSGGVSTGGSGRTSCAWERGRVLGLKRFDFPEITLGLISPRTRGEDYCFPVTPNSEPVTRIVAPTFDEHWLIS